MASYFDIREASVIRDDEHHVWVGTIGGAAAIWCDFCLWSSVSKSMCGGSSSLGDCVGDSCISVSENCNGACSEHCFSADGDGR